MIDDICPGAFAEPPTVSVWMRTGVERIDWRAAEREAFARFVWPHFGPVSGVGDVYTGDRRLPPNSIIQTFVDPIELPDGCSIVGMTFAGPHDSDGYSFRIHPDPCPDCGTCKGTGEIVEFPADEDERLVACPRCGGTGEGLRP